MANLNAEQANQLAHNFLALAQSVGDFRVKNRTTLSPDENQKLADQQWDIMTQGEDMLALSTTLVLNDVTTSLTKINDIGTEIKASIKDLQNIQKGINVATAIVTLGAAVVSKDPQAIVTAITGVVDVWNG